MQSKACIQEQHLQNIPKTFPEHPLATNPKTCFFQFVTQCRQGIQHVLKMLQKKFPVNSFQNIFKMFSNWFFPVYTVQQTKDKHVLDLLQVKCFGNVLPTLLMYTSLKS